MGASQAKQQIGKGNDQSSEQKVAKQLRVPELHVGIETWTRESHGLYDFEGTEIKTLNLRLTGTHRINRVDSNVTVTKLAQNQVFEEQERGINVEERDSVIARCLYKDNSYWIFHKNLIDETAEAVLERKPEDKIWQVVKQIRQPEFDFPCFKINKRDLIKVGRVRFKIRDIMSPAYKERNDQDDYQNQCYRNIYPDYDPSSVANSLSAWSDQSLLEGQVANQSHLNQRQQNIQLVRSQDTESDAELGDDIELDQNVLQLNQNQEPGQGEALDLGQTQIFKGAKNQQPFFKKRKEMQSNNQKEEQESNLCQSEAAVCRICLTEEEPGNKDPLISPCKCAGSMRFIHHSCLKTWFAQKRVMKASSIVTTYFWKNLECELCKSPYPYETKTLNGREMLNIIEYNLPERSQNYIVLESISSNTSKVIHVINMSNTVKLYIGRGHDAHVRVTDISVSRLHAVLIKSLSGFYYLTDNDSKFGTLALVRSPLQLQPDMKTQLQIGRSLLTVEVKHTMQNILLQCLCMSQKENLNQLNLENTDVISLDGIDYFPKEFASQAYIQLMENRKLKQQRSLKLKKRTTLLVQNHITTQQDESVMDPVDQFINYQNDMGSALLSAEDRNQDLLEHSEYSEESEDQQREDLDLNQDFHDSQSDHQHNDQPDQDMSPNQSSDSNEYQSESDEDQHPEEIDAQERAQIEEAIQLSLLIQQQQNNQSRSIHQSRVENQNLEEEKVQADQRAEEEQKKQVYDYFHDQTPLNVRKQETQQSVLTNNNEDLASQISTSRVSQNNAFELRSSNLLLKQVLTKQKQEQPPVFDQPDETLNHDMPTQVQGEKAKAVGLQQVPQISLKSQRNSEVKDKNFQDYQNLSGMNSPLILSKRMAPITSRNTVQEIIVEQHEDLLEDQRRSIDVVENQTIEHQIPNQTTEIDPNKQI